jgi:hypothetical protein
MYVCVCALLVTHLMSPQPEVLVLARRPRPQLLRPEHEEALHDPADVPQVEGVVRLGGWGGRGVRKEGFKAPPGQEGREDSFKCRYPNPLSPSHSHSPSYAASACMLPHSMPSPLLILTGGQQGVHDGLVDV